MGQAKKLGTIYTAFISPDGNTWTQLGDPVDDGFGDGVPIYAGIALCGHDDIILSTATVDNFALNGGVQQFNLQSFTGSLNLDKTVTLQWVTTIELNVRDFIVERSSTMSNFQPIDTLPAVNNGSFTQTYSTDDKTPSVLNYYRLRITNIDGTVTYSEPVFIRVTNSNSPLLFPNPGKSVVHIVRGNEPIRMVNLYDLTGRFINSLSNASNNDIIDMPVSAYANGLYIIEIRTTESVYKEKLLIRN